MVIDNPGMREFGLFGAESEVAGGFPDIAALGAGCRFNDCTHTGEPGCAVLAAVTSGALDRGHYQSFVQLTRESKSSAMSSGQKRKKERVLKSAKKAL
jgi:ribosome biogenesis GTPase